MERGMDVEDHGPLTPPETRSVLKLFETTMLSLHCLQLSRDGENFCSLILLLLESCTHLPTNIQA